MDSATGSTVLSTASISRARERRDRRLKLIRALRTAAFLSSLQAYDEPGLHARCSLARLVLDCDRALRELCNNRETHVEFRPNGPTNEIRQIRRAAVLLAEAGRLLLAQRPQVRSRSIWLTLEAEAGVCHRLVVVLGELEAERIA